MKLSGKGPSAARKEWQVIPQGPSSPCLALETAGLTGGRTTVSDDVFVVNSQFPRTNLCGVSHADCEWEVGVRNEPRQRVSGALDFSITPSPSQWLFIPLKVESLPWFSRPA